MNSACCRVSRIPRGEEKTKKTANSIQIPYHDKTQKVLNVR